ncbi:hypothetical protein EV421DRAFT_1776834, partial [Armillaria borealis]
TYFTGFFLPSNRYKRAPKSPGFSRQTYHPRLSTCLLSAHSSRCVSQLLLSSLSRHSRSLPFPLPSKLGTTRMAMSITRAKTVAARITTTETRVRMAAVATALGRRCLSTRMTSRDGTRASTPPTITRKSTRSPSRSNVRACARRTIDVTLARVRVMFTHAPESSNAFSSSDDKFVCELFVEIIDIDTWKEDCDDGKDDKDHKDGKKDDKKDDNKKDDNKKDDRKDDKKYYDTSAWNAHYGY